MRKLAMDSAYEDSSKRGKLIGLSLLITLGVFFLKIFQEQDYLTYENYLIALGAGIVAYIGLLGVFNFKVNRKALLLFIPQSALLVFSEVLFIELFFFSKFDRVYEAILLLIILVVLFVTSYASFLMTNIFTVSSTKIIPLEQVAKTASYILSLLVSYFLIFAVFSIELHVAFMLILLGFVSFLVAVLHIVHLRLSRRMFRIGVVITVLNMMVCAITSMFLGSKYEIISVAPTIAMFVSVALVLDTEENKLKWYVILEYIVLIIAAFMLNFIV